nr:VOC family protein [Alteribacter populi]
MIVVCEKNREGNYLLHHVEIYVSDLASSQPFWGWLLGELGYKKYQEWEKGVSWRHHDCYLVFVQAEKRFLEISYHRSRVGLNHLAFQVATKHEVDQLTKNLKERNVTILYNDRHPFAGGPDHYAVYFEDPDRIKVEVVAQN